MPKNVFPGGDRQDFLHISRFPTFQPLFDSFLGVPSLHLSSAEIIEDVKGIPDSTGLNWEASGFHQPVFRNLKCSTHTYTQVCLRIR